MSEPGDHSEGRNLHRLPAGLYMETKKDRLFPKRSPCAGSGTRTHTHEAQDPKSCLSTNFNIPARKCKDRNFWMKKNDVAILA